MTQSVVKGQPLLFKMLQHTAENLPEIRIHNLTLVCRYDVVEAASFVHTESQWSVLYFISERELHLVPVIVMTGTFLDPLKLIFIAKGCHYLIQ